MILTACAVFTYYSIWALVLVRRGIRGRFFSSQFNLAFPSSFVPNSPVLLVEGMGRVDTRCSPRRRPFWDRFIARPRHYQRGQKTKGQGQGTEATIGQSVRYSL